MAFCINFYEGINFVDVAFVASTSLIRVKLRETYVKATKVKTKLMQSLNSVQAFTEGVPDVKARILYKVKQYYVKATINTIMKIKVLMQKQS
jgi:hypothetical protein